MHAHVLQHVPFEGLGSISRWLSQRNAGVTYTRFFESPELPTPGASDLVIALGGPMSVNDEEVLPWLAPEKAFLRESIRQGAAVLGICLGAQLIASALGARVYRAPQKEIGWFPIESTSSSPDTFVFPRSATVFHWHGETFDIPEGAVRLARSAGCDNQAFQLGPRVIGLQFHMETTPAAAESIVLHSRDELVDGAFVQTEAEILATEPSAYAAVNALKEDVLTHLARGC